MLLHYSHAFPDNIIVFSKLGLVTLIHINIYLLSTINLDQNVGAQRTTSMDGNMQSAMYLFNR